MSPGPAEPRRQGEGLDLLGLLFGLRGFMGKAPESIALGSPQARNAEVHPRLKKDLRLRGVGCDSRHREASEVIIDMRLPCDPPPRAKGVHDGSGPRLGLKWTDLKLSTES